MNLTIRHGLFHTGANPNMFMDYDTFTPSNYSGIYMKYKMLQEPETRPEEKDRQYVDPSPLSTWEHIIDFDDNTVDFKVYGKRSKDRTNR